MNSSNFNPVPTHPQANTNLVQKANQYAMVTGYSILGVLCIAAWLSGTYKNTKLGEFGQMIGWLSVGTLGVFCGWQITEHKSSQLQTQLGDYEIKLMGYQSLQNNYQNLTQIVSAKDNEITGLRSRVENIESGSHTLIANTTLSELTAKSEELATLRSQFEIKVKEVQQAATEAGTQQTEHIKELQLALQESQDAIDQLEAEVNRMTVELATKDRVISMLGGSTKLNGSSYEVTTANKVADWFDSRDVKVQLISAESDGFTVDIRLTPVIAPRSTLESLLADLSDDFDLVGNATLEPENGHLRLTLPVKQRAKANDDDSETSSSLVVKQPTGWVSKFLRENPSIRFVGPSEAGKTSTCQAFIEVLKEQYPDMPIYVIDPIDWDTEEEARDAWPIPCLSQGWDTFWDGIEFVKGLFNERDQIGKSSSHQPALVVIDEIDLAISRAKAEERKDELVDVLKSYVKTGRHYQLKLFLIGQNGNPSTIGFQDSDNFSFGMVAFQREIDNVMSRSGLDTSAKRSMAKQRTARVNSDGHNYHALFYSKRGSYFIEDNPQPSGKLSGMGAKPVDETAQILALHSDGKSVAEIVLKLWGVKSAGGSKEYRAKRDQVQQVIATIN